MSTFRVTMLPARHGDCIFIEYGREEPLSRILIDGGTPPVWATLKQALESLPEAQRRIELLVITHVDIDHIGGVLGLFQEGLPHLDFDDIWFNGYRHLKEVEEFGPIQAERLTTFLWQRMPQWNKAFGGKAIVVPDEGAPPVHIMPGGMKLTLLSPTRRKLLALLPIWEKECTKAGLNPREDSITPPPAGIEALGGIDVELLASEYFSEDPSEPNGSSIAFLADYDGRSLLLAADAHPTVLEECIARVSSGSVAVGAFKVSHHGSKLNTSPGLLEKIKTSRYLISTNGAQFHHPNRETIARILKASQSNCELWFNYRSPYTEVWDSDELRKAWNYTSHFPQRDKALVLDL